MSVETPKPTSRVDVTSDYTQNAAELPFAALRPAVLALRPPCAKWRANCVVRRGIRANSMLIELSPYIRLLVHFRSVDKTLNADAIPG